MALVDPSTLGAPRINLLETLRSHEHGLIRRRNEFITARDELSNMKQATAKVIDNYVIKPLGVPHGHVKIDVSFTKAPVGENPEARIKIIVSKRYEFMVVEKLRAMRMEFKVTPSSETNSGGVTKITLVLHERYDHVEARQPRSIR